MSNKTTKVLSDDIIFEVGDRVWSFSRREWGTVKDLDDESIGCIYVKFDSVTYHFSCLKRDLFFEEFIVPESARVRPQPKHEFKPGEVVMAKGFEGQTELRVFVRSKGGSVVLRALGIDNYDYEHPLSRIKPYDKTILGFDADEGGNGNERN